MSANPCSSSGSDKVLHKEIFGSKLQSSNNNNNKPPTWVKVLLIIIGVILIIGVIVTGTSLIQSSLNKEKVSINLTYEDRLKACNLLTNPTLKNNCIQESISERESRRQDAEDTAVLEEATLGVGSLALGTML